MRWQLREQAEAEESDDGSDCSVRTVKSALSESRPPPLDTGQIKGLCQFSLPASVVSSRRGSGDFEPAFRKSGKPGVKVESEDGTVFYADQLICTIPLGEVKSDWKYETTMELIFQIAGLLQNNPHYFDPPLPRAKQESLKKMVFGVVNKIFLSYEAPFLNPDISEIITLWNKIDEKQVPIEERWFRKIYSFCKGEQLAGAQENNCNELIFTMMLNQLV